MNKLKREDARWMMVWDDHEGEKIKRLVVVVFESGGCVAVDDDHEDDFIHDCGVGFTYWDHCEPIPEKKKRLMTNAEIFKAIREGAVVRVRGDKKNASNYWHITFSLDNREICYNYTGTNADKWEPLEVEE